MTRIQQLDLAHLLLVAGPLVPLIFIFRGDLTFGGSPVELAIFFGIVGLAVAPIGGFALAWRNRFYRPTMFLATYSLLLPIGSLMGPLGLSIPNSDFTFWITMVLGLALGLYAPVSLIVLGIWIRRRPRLVREDAEVASTIIM